MLSHALKIVLTDDDEDDRMFFTEALEELNLGTDVATYADVSQLMENMHLENIPNILFLDLNMPKKTGFECLKEVRLHPKYEPIFIVIYSTSDAVDDVNLAFKHGANLYVKKPNSFDGLKKMLLDITTNWQHYFTQVDRSKFLFRV